MHPEELDLVWSELSRLSASIEVAYGQLSTTHAAAIIATEAGCDQNRALNDAGEQEGQDSEPLLVEVQCDFDDHSPVIRPC